MKKVKNITLFALLFIGLSTLSFAQDKTPSYKDLVTANPNAETDIKIVGDYTNALVNNKMDIAANQLSEKYMSYGPSANDSINKTDEIASWKKAHLVRTNQKVNFVSETFQVTQGELKGNWVSQWGTYNFTEGGKDIFLPYQLTALVANGKIEMSRIYFDNLAVLMALGYTVTPPKKSE